MRPLTDTIPKPMVRVGEYPLLHHIMRQYSRYGIHEFIICLGYKGEIIKDYFLNYQQQYADVTIDFKRNRIRYLMPELEWDIVLAETGEKTMTGGRLLAAQKYIPQGEAFFFTYGDALSDVDILDTFRFHQTHGKTLTITAVHPKNNAGVITMDERGNIKTFSEKPLENDRWINGGFFVANYDIFRYIEGDIPFEEAPIQELVASDEAVAYRHNGWWQCADTEKEVAVLADCCKKMYGNEAVYDRRIQEAAF